MGTAETKSSHLPVVCVRAHSLAHDHATEQKEALRNRIQSDVARKESGALNPLPDAGIMRPSDVKSNRMQIGRSRER